MKLDVKQLLKNSSNFIKEIWESSIIANPANQFKLVISVILCIFTCWIGYVFADVPGINGWQFWTWLCCVIAILFILYEKPTIRLHTNFWILLGLFVPAMLIRVVFLESIPGLFHLDEAGVAEFAKNTIFTDPKMQLNPFIAGPASMPTLHHYILRITMDIFGFTIFGLRISSVVAGAFGVVFTYLLIKTISNKRTALFAAAMMVTYHFAMHWSRIGLNNIWDVFWIPLCVYALYKGWKEKWYGGAVFSGFALGMSQYFYNGSKMALFLLPFIFLLLWKQEPDLKWKLGFLARMGAVALCVAGPIFMYALRVPAVFFERTNQVFGWRDDAILILLDGRLNYWEFFWRQLTLSLGTYTIYPDPTGFYNPGIPLLIGPAAILFITGIVLAFSSRSYIPLMWVLLTTFFGGFLLGVPNSCSHYVVVIPAICWLVGMSLNWIWEHNWKKMSVVLLIAIMAVDVFYYFVVFLNLPPEDFKYPFPM